MVTLSETKIIQSLKRLKTTESPNLVTLLFFLMFLSIAKPSLYWPFKYYYYYNFIIIIIGISTLSQKMTSFRQFEKLLSFRIGLGLMSG